MLLWVETPRVFSHRRGWSAARRLSQYPASHGDCLRGKTPPLLTPVRCKNISSVCVSIFCSRCHYVDNRVVFADVVSRPFQSIRSKMSIRAEEKPKAFETQFLTTSGNVAQYGAFDFRPGTIVRGKNDIETAYSTQNQTRMGLDPNA